jgi:SAM-dependent methyltransferase
MLRTASERAGNARCPACEADGARPLFPLAAGTHTLWRCRACRLAFLWPPPADEVLEAVYGSYYHDGNAALHPLTAARYHDILARLERPRGPGRILDVGCGAGQFLEVARARGWQAEGTEVSAAAVPFLEARGTRVHRGELTELDLEGFHAVTLFEVLEHVRRPQAHLHAAARLLRPGGALYLTTPNFDGLSRRLLGPRWRVMAPEHLSYYSPPALRDGLPRAGLGGVTIRTRNLDVVDLLHKLRRRELPGGHSNIAETTALRERVEKRRSLLLAKAAVNRALGLFDAGDTLEAFAWRGEGGGS